MPGPAGAIDMNINIYINIHVYGRGTYPGWKCLCSDCAPGPGGRSGPKLMELTQILTYELE